MITKNYNPSPLEVEITNIIFDLKDEISAKLGESEITEVVKDLASDNPDLVIRTKDKDGDKHEFMLRIIQKPDSRIN
ncbi:MAG: hypothetical protein RH860_06750 [Cytophagales bacterium]